MDDDESVRAIQRALELGYDPGAAADVRDVLEALVSDGLIRALRLEH